MKNIISIIKLLLLLFSVSIYSQKTIVNAYGEKIVLNSINKTILGLSKVDNTSDVNKPLSTNQQNGLNLKANLASPAFTGIPKVPTAARGTNSTQIATTAYVADVLSQKPTIYQGSGSPVQGIGNVKDIYVESDGINTVIWYKIKFGADGKWVKENKVAPTVWSYVDILGDDPQANEKMASYIGQPCTFALIDTSNNTYFWSNTAVVNQQLGYHTGTINAYNESNTGLFTINKPTRTDYSNFTALPAGKEPLFSLTEFNTLRPAGTYIQVKIDGDPNSTGEFIKDIYIRSDQIANGEKGIAQVFYTTGRDSWQYSIQIANGGYNFLNGFGNKYKILFRVYL